jgi:hypothetical protein
MIVATCSEIKPRPIMMNSHRCDGVGAFAFYCPRPIESDVAYGAFSFTSRVRVDARADPVSVITFRPCSGLFGLGHPGFISSGFL